MDSATYRQIMGQFTKSRTTPHHYFPCHNLVSLETFLKVSKDLNGFDDDLNDFNEFMTKFVSSNSFEYDVEMSTAFYCGSGIMDVATNLVKMKLKWERQLKKIKVSDRRKAIRCIRKLELNEPVQLSNNLIKFINCFQQDPEPSFKGSYNWLYSGGNLSSVTVNDEVFLISPDYIDKKSVFNVLKLNKSLDEIEYKFTCNLKTQSPVLQISSKCYQGNTFVFVRQKDNVTLVRIKDLNSYNFIEKLWRKKVASDKLLTSVDVSSECDEVLITDTNNDVHIFNIETKQKIFSYANRVLKDRDWWNEAIFGELGIYLADRNNFYIIDPRDENQEPKLLYNPLSVTNNCEDICSIVKSGCDSNYVYLGTTHNFVQLDIRNNKPVQRWTHLMKNPPQFAECVKVENNDFVVLQSQKIEETLGLTNKYNKDDDDEEAYFFSRSSPCVLSGVKESLKLARLNGLCLHPSIAKRFDFAVTGVQCLMSPKSDIHLFIENSAGDIFLNKIRKKSCNRMSTDEHKDEILNSMKAYEDYFETFVPREPDTKQTERIDLGYLLNDLRTKDPAPKMCRPSESHWKQHEMFTPESLQMYKDVLAQKILNVWGYESIRPDLDDQTMSSTAKVQEWMEKL